MENWIEQVQGYVVAVGSATIADAVIFLIAASSLFAVLFLMRLSKSIDSAASDSGIRGKLDKVETLLNEIRSERLRSEQEHKKELEALKASIGKTQSATA
jgi:large-conductance mechanosensitive channel